MLIIEIARNIVIHPSIKYKNNVQMWTTALHSRWAIQTQWWHRDEEIAGMCVTINAIESWTDMPDCTTAAEIRVATLDIENLVLL